MELGTGIFLSSGLIAVVLLYGMTKDRWSWRKIAKRTMLSLVAFVIVGTAAVTGMQWWNQLPVKLPRQIEYAGLRLGMTQNEVMYIRGIPGTVLTEEVDDPKFKGFYKVVETKNLEKGKRVTDYRHWWYSGREHTVMVIFNEKRSGIIKIECRSEDRLSRCPDIGGIADGHTEDELIRKLGPASRSSFQDTNKSLFYDELGVKFALSKRQVYGILVGDLQDR